MDIVERLRREEDALDNEAADYIERLRKALKEYDCGCPEKWWDNCSDPSCGLTALRALQQKESE